MRNNGLDLIRSSAIVLVLICHSTMFISKDFNTYGLMFITGYLGVEIFFVLSGFLIGSIIIADVYERKSFLGLKKFYLRRWLRTLPLYYLVVLVLALTKGSFTWENLFFIQNFKAETLEFNPVSWSLSIEEWFYLLAPLLFLLIARMVKKSDGLVFIGICISVILLELFARLLHFNGAESTWDFEARKQIFLRMDSIMFGVLLSGIKHYYYSLYNKISRSKLLLFLSVIVFVFLGVYDFYQLIVGNKINDSFFSKTFLFSIISLCITVFVSNAESSEKLNAHLSRSTLGKTNRFVSTTSYAVYLIHYEMFLFINARILKASDSVELKLIILALSIALVYIVAWGLHKYFEHPIMKYRDSKYPPKKVISC